MDSRNFLNRVKIFFSNFNDYVCRDYVIGDNHFIRKSKLTQKDITSYVLIQSGLTNIAEAYRFCQQYKKQAINHVTKQAIGRRRQHLSSDLYIDMYKDFQIALYEDLTHVPKYNGHLVLAADGSNVRLPNCQQTKDEFNVAKNTLRPRLSRGRLSCIVDTLTKMVLDVKLADKADTEIELAIQHLKSLNNTMDLEQCITAYDRGYDSLELILQTMKINSKYVIRLRKDVFEKEIQRTRQKNGGGLIDEEILISTNAVRLGNVKDPEILEMMKNTPYIQVRITEVELDTGEIERLISNLPIEEFTTEDLNHIYGLRWKIENCFDSLKNQLCIENFASRSRNLIEQELYGKIVIYNLSMALKLYVEAILKQNKQLPQDNAVNFNATIAALKLKIIKLLKTRLPSRIEASTK